MRGSEYLAAARPLQIDSACSCMQHQTGRLLHRTSTTSTEGNVPDLAGNKGTYLSWVLNWHGAPPAPQAGRYLDGSWRGGTCRAPCLGMLLQEVLGSRQGMRRAVQCHSFSTARALSCRHVDLFPAGRGLGFAGPSGQGIPSPETLAIFFAVAPPPYPDPPHPHPPHPPHPPPPPPPPRYLLLRGWMRQLLFCVWRVVRA